MSFDLNYLFAVTIFYLLTLFLIAYAAEHGWIAERIIEHPVVYALSLGVYATSWSYYGSVGFAAEQGFLFLTIYLGPTLAFILTPLLLRPLLRLSREYQLTSLADLFAFRYSSQSAGVFVTLFMLLGTLPYIALQIRAVTESIRILTQDAPPLELGLMFCLVLMLFAILFGARHISPRDKHTGLVLAIAFESLIKLLAILAVALFAFFNVFGGGEGLQAWLTQHPQALHALYQPVHEAPWLTLLLLSFGAAFLLPRQFHMLFVEHPRRGSLAMASWLFPLYLLLFNLAIPLILWAGRALDTSVAAEYYTLGITLSGNQVLLSTLAFIGGISAASAMVIVTSLALSQMALNHLLLPASYPDPDLDMYGWLLWGRRMLIIGIIMISYLLYVVLERNTGLVELGLISFVAVAQFLPGIVGILLWQRATRAGFLSGLLAGAVIWYLSLVEPLLAQSGLISVTLELRQLLGLGEENIWSFVTFWSLAVNTALFVVLSLLTRQDDQEQRAVAACFQTGAWFAESSANTLASVPQLEEQLGRVIGVSASDIEISKALADLGLTRTERRPHELRRLRVQIERNLSGMLGPMLARMIIDVPPQAAADARSMLADHMRFVEDRLEQSRSHLQGLSAELDALRRYHRQILQDLPLGACSLSVDGEILHWNQAMEQLSGIPARDAIGGTIQVLPQPWNDLLGNILQQEAQHIHKIQLLIHNRPHWFNLHKAAIAPEPQWNSHSPGRFRGGMVILVEDLTEVQTLEAELAHSERLASIGRLAAGIAHEIGNPITGIACLTQNLRYENDATIVAESLDEILQQTERINAIVRSLLSYSHSGMAEDHRADWSGEALDFFNLYEAATEAQRLVTLSHHAKQLDFINHCPVDLQAYGDRQRIIQVLLNLLSNAAEASQPGARIEIDAGAQQGTLTITVSDEGKGIPQTLQGRVFEPFFTTKEPGEGTGLGLALVYSIVRDHGGRISIANSVLPGTQISVHLPLPEHKT